MRGGVRGYDVPLQGRASGCELWPDADTTRRAQSMEQPMNCPHCGKPINAAAMLGSISTPAKAQAARENAKLGGWPKGKKRGKRKRVARRQND